MVRARKERGYVVEAGRRKNEVGKQEVARLRTEFEQVVTMQQVQERQRTRV